jgi:small-conductance mechanosensitive channel
LQFVVNYPYDTDIDEAKKELEEMLEKEHEELRLSNEKSDKEN